MSLLIKNLDMPDCGYICLKLFANGEMGGISAWMPLPEPPKEEA